MRLGALEAGGTKMVCAIGNEQGEIFERVSIPTETPEITMPKLIAYFKDKEIEALGKTFDPHFHEAVMMLPADDKEDETISMVFQKGYLYKDSVLRVAKVQVVHNG